MSRKLPEHMPKVKYCVVRKHKTVKLWILEFLGFRCGQNKRRRKDKRKKEKRKGRGSQKEKSRSQERTTTVCSNQRRHKETLAQT